MSTKPPVALPPRIAGVKTPVAPKEEKYPIGHKCTIQDRSADRTQFYPFHVDCQCGFHASCYTKIAAQNAITIHWTNIKGIVL
jgi:hypothetical protein